MGLPFHGQKIYIYIYIKKNYLTSSDPYHDMSGGGCQVRVVIYLNNISKQALSQQASPPSLFLDSCMILSCSVCCGTLISQDRG